MTVFKKSFFTLSFALFCFSLVLVILTLFFMNSLYYEINSIGLNSTAKTLMTAIGENRIIEYFKSNDRENLPALPLHDDNIHRLTLVDTSGNVLWDSHVRGTLVNHIDREEIISALDGKEGRAARNSISLRVSQIYCALPVFENGRVIGVFRLSFTVPSFGLRIMPALFPVIMLALFLIIAALWVIYIFSHTISNSFARIVTIAQLGTAMLSGPEANTSVTMEFESLEKTLRAITWELDYRFKKAKEEGIRLEAILNGLSEAVFAMDSDLVLLLVNPSARKLFNFNGNDIENFTLLEASNSAELQEIAKKALLDGVCVEQEFTLYTGTEQNFHVYAAPLTVGQGVVLVMRDITRLIRLERVRKDFVANVSHELRTPIQLVKGFSETLLDLTDELKGSDKQKEKIVHIVEIISKNAGTMENLTNDLLVLANLENNTNNKPDMENTALAPLVTDAVSSLETPAKRKQIELIVNCPNALYADVYGSFIVQALINLIDNAIKYSTSGSKVWVNASEENGELILEVRDKGIGIAPEHLQRVFERFYRVDRARSREAGGTGLGLSIVRHIALLHGGNIEVESHAAEGSIFRIRIPLHQTRQQIQ
jgi:two-component system phosphate regulon sensor histidine kinase PhoR